jgi:hypothetical protein
LLAHARNAGTLVNDRYAALREALTAAIEAGGVLTVLTILKEFDTQFTVDSRHQTLQALDELSKGLKSAEQRMEFVERVTPLVDRAFADGDYELASELSNLMLTPARGTGDNVLFRRIAGCHWSACPPVPNASHASNRIPQSMPPASRHPEQPPNSQH